MVEPVETVLLVDVDGVGRGLAASGGKEMVARLAERIDEWLAGIEAGELIEPSGTSRTVIRRHCYFGPAGAAASRAAFEGAGFIVRQCVTSQVDLCLAVDAMDAAADSDGARDFILLTAASDLTPLVDRLGGRGHRVAIYASEATAAGYREAADMVLPATALATLLAAEETAPPARMPTAERGQVEAFAREVHAATNIPMFSPKTFADLFRFLASEVTEHGYHFNDTAKTVAERMVAAGRNVTSRQVVFVVKGLALKGHVFSTSDTAERLAEVFREQARYLIEGAGVALDADREALLKAWIAAPAALPARATRPPQAAAAPPKPAPRPARPAAEAKPASKPIPMPAPKPAGAAPRAEKPVEAKAPEPRPAEAKPAPRAPATPHRVPERPKSAALKAKAASPLPRQDAAKSAPSADLRATIAARIAASAKMKPSARPPMKTEEAPPPPPKPAPQPTPEDAIESSILAAIAEAVDVLVEDGGSSKKASRSPSPEREATPPAEDRTTREPPAAEPPPAPPQDDVPDEVGGEGGDIGDEIQRIVASYNRNRDPGQRS